jgi:hypothetical protein
MRIYHHFLEARDLTRWWKTVGTSAIDFGPAVLAIAEDPLVLIPPPLATPHPSTEGAQGVHHVPAVIPGGSRRGGTGRAAPGAT